MSLEATMILMDNSDYSRNGDLYPSRWEAQLESIQLIANSKLENSESGVGLILSAGTQVQLLMTPTNDMNQLVSTCENQRLRGQIRFSVAAHIAQLALKHRVNKKQAQRIMAFVASPVEEDEGTLITLAKKLKKNNFAVDIINFGEQREDHIAKLQKFIETVKKGNNSMFVNIRPGESYHEQLFTALSNSAKDFQTAPDASSHAQPAQAVQQFAEYGGIDPNVDPELAMAMKFSLEEAINNPPQVQPAQQQPGQQAQPQQPQPQPPSSSAMQEEPLNPSTQPNLSDSDAGEEEELLRRAKELSLEEEARDQLLQKPKLEQEEGLDEFQDKDFMEELLKSANVDLNSEEAQSLLKKQDDKSDKPPK